MVPQYAFFFSYPVVFGDDYHWNDGLVGLTFISVWIGLAMALAVMPFLQKDYMRRAEAKGGKAEPEDRLVGMMIGSIWVPICTFTSRRTPYSSLTSFLHSPFHLRLDKPPGRHARWWKLGRPRQLGHPVRLRHGRDLLLRERVHHRRLPWLCRLRARGQDGYPVWLWCSDAPVHHGHVPQPRERMGREYVGVHLFGYGE